MKNIKNTITLTVILVALDIAVLEILKIIKIIDSDQFSNLIKDSLSIIGVIFLVGLVISMLFNLNNK
jgi:hypothetical protein